MIELSDAIFLFSFAEAVLSGSGRDVGSVSLIFALALCMYQCLSESVKTDLMSGSTS